MVVFCKLLLSLVEFNQFSKLFHSILVKKSKPFFSFLEHWLIDIKNIKEKKQFKCSLTIVGVLLLL